MRTTLTLDEDIAEAIRERARILEVPFKQVVNDALRRGLWPEKNRNQNQEYRVVPNHSGLANGVDPLRLNQINDHLEAEAFDGSGSN